MLLVKAAAGYELKIAVRIELGGNPPESVVDKIGPLLQDVNPKLKLK